MYGDRNSPRWFSLLLSWEITRANFEYKLNILWHRAQQWALWWLKCRSCPGSGRYYTEKICTCMYVIVSTRISLPWFSWPSKNMHDPGRDDTITVIAPPRSLLPALLSHRDCMLRSHDRAIQEMKWREQPRLWPICRAAVQYHGVFSLQVSRCNNPWQ